MNVFDTIAAVSTPRGKGGIAVIRISGDRAAEVADRVFRPKSGRLLSETEPQRQVWGDIFATAPDGKLINIDDGMGVFFKGPHSFTGEDTVEISCHGGMLITQSVLEAVLAAGARYATPGEFTRRAFISGRITLTQAEALGELLDAKTENQMILSRSGVKGALSDKIDALYSGLENILSSIYAKIDFPEEDLAEMGREEIERSVRLIRDEAVSLAATYKTGRAVKEGLRTVICGRTNAGKSSLYNMLVGREAAIVTEIEGTTRDLLEETIPFGGVTLRLCDTAGLRDTDDKVESIGVERARAEIREAELVLAVFDGTRTPDKEDELFVDELSTLEGKVIPIINKSDVMKKESGVLRMLSDKGLGEAILISAKSGEGRESLASAIDSRFTDGSLDLRNDAIISDARQYSAVVRAVERLDCVISALAAGYELDLCCIDAEGAMAQLGEINGHSVNEDIISSIFSRFCVGK